MLINRKVTKDKRVMTDFRHLNMGIAKNNFAYPILKDTFSVLHSSRCDVLSVRFEGCFPFYKTFRKFKKILWDLAIFW